MFKNTVKPQPHNHLVHIYKVIHIANVTLVSAIFWKLILLQKIFKNKKRYKYNIISLSSNHFIGICSMTDFGFLMIYIKTQNCL